MVLNTISQGFKLEPKFTYSYISDMSEASFVLPMLNCSNTFRK